MKIKLSNAACTLYREPGDKRLNSENAVTHAMKTLLRAQGFDAARVRGPVGLTSCKQVLQVRDARFTLWHERYQIENAHTAFNQDGSVTYQRVNDDMRTVYETEGLDFPLRAAEAGAEPKRLTARKAYEIVSQWGSYMRDGDPGAVFYTFSGDKVVVQDREHQRQLLAYTDACMRTAKPKQRTELQLLRDYFETACVPEPSQIDYFSGAYIQAALWSTTRETEDSPDRPLSEDFSISDLDRRTFSAMAHDCWKFQQENAELLKQAYAAIPGPADDSQAGHDFWLTRNHHGAGFWDRGYPKALGDALTKAAHAYGECDLYIGDDGLLHI